MSLPRYAQAAALVRVGIADGVLALGAPDPSGCGASPDDRLFVSDLPQGPSQADQGTHTGARCQPQRGTAAAVPAEPATFGAETATAEPGAAVLARFGWPSPAPWRAVMITLMLLGLRPIREVAFLFCRSVEKYYSRSF